LENKRKDQKISEKLHCYSGRKIIVILIVRYTEDTIQSLVGKIKRKEETANY
jgi:hypothetical protein